MVKWFKNDKNRTNRSQLEQHWSKKFAKNFSRQYKDTGSEN